MDYLNRISLVIKLKIYLYIIIVTFLIISIVLFISFSQSLTSESKTQMETISNYVRDESLAPLPILYKLVIQLSKDKTLANFIDTDYSTINSSFSTEQNKINTMLYQIRQFIPNAMVYIYHNNRSVESANEFLVNLDTAKDFDWLDVKNLSQRHDAQWGIGSLLKNG